MRRRASWRRETDDGLRLTAKLGCPKRAGVVRGSRPDLRARRGSALAAALALTFLIFAIATTSMLRVASSYTRITSRHLQTSALVAAEAGVQLATERLARDRSFTGERNGSLPTGSFDVSVAREGDAFVITSTGRSGSGQVTGRKTVRVVARAAADGSFSITDWREDP